MPDISQALGDTFGFSGWNLGLGFFGNLMVWLFVVIVLCGIIGFLVYLYVNKRTFKHKIETFGMAGNQPMERWKDVAKEVKIGRAGDKLWYLKKQKRYIPPAIIPSGVNKWVFWEREDGYKL